MFQDVYEGFTWTTLPNGLTVYVQPREVSWVYVGAVVHAGAKEDPIGRQGLAHLVEHLVSENIDGFSFPMLEKRFQALGGTAHFGTTSYVSTTYDFHVPAEEPAVQEALTLFSTMLLQGCLTRKIEEEKAVIQREYYTDYPHALSRTWALRGRPWLFEWHPRLHSFHSALGVLEEWMPCSQPEIQAFYDRSYTPANMTLVCIGACSQERLLHLLEDTPFVLSKPGERTRLPTSYVSTPPSRQEQVIHLSQFSHLAPAQTACTIEWVIPLHVRRYSVFLLAGLLEELLTEQWRYQRALTYDVSVNSQYYQDCRVLTLHSELPQIGWHWHKTCSGRHLAPSRKHSSVLGR
jgi:predicted Zn-dependent peptidase